MSSLSDITYSNRALLKDVWCYLRPYKARFFAATFLRLVSDIAWLYPAYAMASIINFFTRFHNGDSLRPFWTIMALLLAAAITRYVGHSLCKYYGFTVAEKMRVDASVRSIKHITSLDIAWHEKLNAGNKIKIIDKGGEGLNKLIRVWFANVIEISVNLVGMTVVLAFFDRSVALLLVVFFITYYFASTPLLNRAVTASRAVDDVDDDLGGLAFEILNNIRSIKVLGMAQTLFKRFEIITKELIERIRLRVYWFQMRSGVMSLFHNAFRMTGIIIIALGVAQGKFAIGFLVLFHNYFNRFIESASEMSELGQDVIVAKYGIARMQHMLNEKVVIDDDKGKVDFPANWKKLTVKNLSFAYGDNEVLKNISLEIKRGERIGIVGLSGAGKSTLFKLLLKENEDFTGDILFDDISIRDIKKSSFYNYSAVVMQDTEVFNFSLRDNITIANTARASDKALLDEALEIAHVRDFVNRLPLGLETLIGEKGIKLSGGEKQRVGIARAVFKEPQLLFMDEATSHLDLESEEKIQDSLHHFFQQVTAIVIAHRLTTIKEMDRILLIENGGILESGNFAKLYKSRGRFYDLWEKQRL